MMSSKKLTALMAASLLIISSAFAQPQNKTGGYSTINVTPNPSGINTVTVNTHPTQASSAPLMDTQGGGGFAPQTTSDADIQRVQRELQEAQNDRNSNTQRIEHLHSLTGQIRRKVQAYNRVLTSYNEEKNRYQKLRDTCLSQGLINRCQQILQRRMNQLRNTQQRLQRYSQNIVQFERDLNTAQSLIPVLEENDRDLASQITSLNNELWFLKTNIDQNTLEYVRGGVL